MFATGSTVMGVHFTRDQATFVRKVKSMRECTPDDSPAGLKQPVQQSLAIQTRVTLGCEFGVKVQVAWGAAFNHL